jgi:hypothetical protein
MVIFPKIGVAVRTSRSSPGPIAGRANQWGRINGSGVDSEDDSRHVSVSGKPVGLRVNDRHAPIVRCRRGNSRNDPRDLQSARGGGFDGGHVRIV